MLYRRVRKLGGMLGAEGDLHYFIIAPRSRGAVRAIAAAKLEGHAGLAAQVKAAFERYLLKYFPEAAGWRLTVPRGSGRASFMYRLWREDARFVPCFRHEVPVGIPHDWRARLGHYPLQVVTAPVAGMRIVLLDDLLTTGSTLAAHLVPLLRAGAEATALVLAGH